MWSWGNAVFVSIGCGPEIMNSVVSLEQKMHGMMGDETGK